MIDTHTHLNFPELAQDLQGILERARESNVSRYIVPGTTVESSQSSVNLSEHNPAIYSAIGIHPGHSDEVNEEALATMQEMIDNHQRVVAIGEVGLDYFHFEDCTSDREREERKELQKVLFTHMISLVQENDLPLIIHSREAFTDIYNILKEKASGWRVVIHCFTGTAEEAKLWLNLGCYLSFTGILTYKKNSALRDVAATVPLDRIMLETDSPFLAPEGFRGTLCEPKYVRNVAQCIADLKGLSLEEIDQITTANAERFFQL